MRSVLIVDDDPDAVLLTKRALLKAGVQNPVDVVENGAEAIAYLTECLSRGKESLPLLVFLDLNMPRTDGFEVLDWIRTEPALRSLLTVVLSSSTNRRDVDRAYALGAKTYLGKYPVPSDISSIFQLANVMLSVEEIERFVLPGIERPVAIEDEMVRGERN